MSLVKSSSVVYLSARTKRELREDVAGFNENEIFSTGSIEMKCIAAKKIKIASRKLRTVILDRSPID